MSDESRFRNGLRLVKELLLWPWRGRSAAERVALFRGIESGPHATEISQGAYSSQLSWVALGVVLIQLGGRRILVDSVGGLRPWSSLWRRRPEERALWKDIDPINAFVVTRRLGSEMDSRLLKVLSRRTPVVVPTGLGESYCRRGFNQVVELAAGEQFAHGDLEVTALPGGGVTGRSSLWRKRPTTWRGFAIRVTGNLERTGLEGRGCERAGTETVWFLERAEAGRGDPNGSLTKFASHSPPGVVLIPVRGEEPGWLARHQGMGPEQALQAFRTTGGRVFLPLPITWPQDSVQRLDDLVASIQACWNRHRPPGKELLIPRPGTTVEIGRHS